MSNTHTNLLFHIVYSTKYRRNLIRADKSPRIYEYIGGVIREQKGVLIEIGGISDHVHILARLSPTLAISDVLRITKANSSKWINETFQPNFPFAWQRGFGAFSVSASNVKQVRNYIQNQEQHHKRMSFRDEYRQLLIRHEITFDEKYLFEEEQIG
ncbi:IS200/IS605 family transposase [Novipirellula rosea]|uniref:IS200/IS605 family transposase n=1 Tax=Novipirellula rosea TaxID=1031540 RepID=A0ABP8MIK2_9BACT|tara:strand:- start:138 stop:605 length:468 start_codon:yes stop_codon:yes gene_type:complete